MKLSWCRAIWWSCTASPLSSRGVRAVRSTPQVKRSKIMSTITPVHAVAYHFLNEEATRFNLYEAIRETYSGPLSMATDNMVWNITANGVKERMAVITEEAWAVAGPTRQGPPQLKKGRAVFSDFTNAGYWLPAYEAQNDAMDIYMKKYGLEDQDWRPGLMKQIEQANKR